MRTARTVTVVAGRLVRGVAALVVLLALLAGVPWLLWHLIGWPLPDHLPSGQEVLTRLGQPMDDQFLANALACVAWVSWAGFAVQTAAQTVAAVTEVHHNLPAYRAGTLWPRPGDADARWGLGRVAGALVWAVIFAVLPAPSTATLHLAPALAATAEPFPDTDHGAATPARTTRAAPPSGGAATPDHAPGHTGAVGLRTMTVRPPHGRAHDSLWLIAERELGNPRRWHEIYALNVGRLQPDGQRLRDPDLIYPGWILRLPATPTTSSPAPAPPGPATTAPPPTRGPAPAPGTTPAATPATPAPAPSATAGPTPTTQPTPAASTPAAATGQAGPRPTAPARIPPTTAAPTASPVTGPAAASPGPGRRSHAVPGIGVELPGGGYVGLGLAVAVSALLGLARLRRRRRDRLDGPLTFRLPLTPPVGEPPPRVASVLRQAHLATRPDMAPDPDDDRGDLDPDDPGAGVGAAATAAGNGHARAPLAGQGDPATPLRAGQPLVSVVYPTDTETLLNPPWPTPAGQLDPDLWAATTPPRPDRDPEPGSGPLPVLAPVPDNTTGVGPLRVALGETSGRQVDVDLARLGGLGLDGPGALGAARAVIAELLVTVRRGRPTPRARVVIPYPDAVDLLADPSGLPPHLLVVPDTDAALDLAEATVGPESGPTALLLVLTPTPPAVARLRALLTQPDRPRLGAVLLGPSPAGPTCTLTIDGRVIAAPRRGPDTCPDTTPGTSPPDRAPGLPDLTGARLFHLNATDLAGILQVLRSAGDDDPEEPPAGPPHHREPTAGPHPAGTAPAEPTPGRPDPGTHPPEAPPTPATTQPETAPAEHPPQSRPARPLSAVPPTDRQPPAPGTTDVSVLAGPSPTPTPAPGEFGTAKLAAPVGTAEQGGPAAREWVQAALAAQQWTATLSVRLLGTVRLHLNGQEVPRGLRGKTLELLAYLLLHPGGVTGDAAGEALWPGRADTSDMLRSAMKRLRAQLRAITAVEQEPFIHYASGSYRPDRRLLDCDVWAFQAAVEQAATAATDPSRLDALARAVGLYQGQLLDGCLYDWATPYQEALRHHGLHAFVRYAVALEDTDPEAALAALERALAIDAFNETLYRRVMRLQARLGRPEAVTGTLTLLRRQLTQIDQHPDKTTLSLAASLQKTEPSTGPAKHPTPTSARP
jgi:DNA-binding SARP family transcriptional activator